MLGEKGDKKPFSPSSPQGFTLQFGGRFAHALVGQSIQNPPESGRVLAVVLLRPVQEQVFLPPQCLGAQDTVKARMGPKQS